MSFCLWLTGLPGSGNSTILNELSRMLLESGIEAIGLSLDHIRKILTPEPKYTDEERAIVYRALVMMAQHLVDQGGKNVIIDATGNRSEFRDLGRRLIREFAEVYVKCPLEICMAREAARRDQFVQKDLYKRASEGALKGQLRGVSAPYEKPEIPEVLVTSDLLSPHESAKRIMEYIRLRWTG